MLVQCCVLIGLHMYIYIYVCIYACACILNPFYPMQGLSPVLDDSYALDNAETQIAATVIEDSLPELDDVIPLTQSDPLRAYS